MDGTVSKGRRLQFLMITVLLLLLPFGWYYFIYVSHQQVYLTDRNFRLLGLTSQQIQARLEYMNISWDQMNKELESNYSKIPLESKVSLETFTNEARGNIKRISGLERADITVEPKPDQHETSAEFTVERKRDTVEAFFRFRYSTKVTNEACEPPQCFMHISARSNLASFLTPLVNRHEFDDVLVGKQPERAQDEYEVFFQREPRGIQVLTLPLPLQKNQPSETPMQSRANRLDTIELGGTRYMAFLQPVQLSFSTSSGKTEKRQWLVCGLVRADRFLSESFSIPIPVLLGLVFLLLMTPLAWPFLKLWFIRPRERLLPSDVVFLLCSILLGTALFTLLLLDAYAYWQLAVTKDEQLQTLATDMQDNFHAELHAMHQQLSRLIPIMEDEVKSSTKRDEGDRSVSLQIQALASSAMRYPFYPYFDIVFLVDSAGWQRSKWDVQAQTTPLINLHERDYVGSILYCWSWVRPSNGALIHFYIDPIYSWNTGENLTLYSIPLQERSDASLTCPSTYKDGIPQLAVAALATRPLSLTHPVLPPGFGYAVMTADGSVLFHVDDTHNLRENLFAETAQNKRLRSAVLGHAAEWLDASYEGKPHRLYILPIDGLPWFLVVYRDEALLSTAHLELLSVVMILVLGYFLLLIGLLLLYRWLAGETFHWLWPAPARTVDYWLFGVSNLLLTFGVGGLGLDRPPFLVGAIVFLPALELVLIAVFLRRGLARRVGFPGTSEVVRKRDAWWFRHGYVFAMASLFLPLSVVPTLAFFQVAHDEEMALLVKHGQLQLARALEARESRVKFQYIAVEVGDKEQFLTKRLQLQNVHDIYASFFFDTHIERAGQWKATAHRDAWGIAWALQLMRPLYSEASLVLRGVSEPGSAEQLGPAPLAPLAWEWERQGPQQKQLILTKNRLEDRGNLRLTSTIPVLAGPLEVGGWIILLSGVVMFPGLLLLSVRIIAQRVFLRDVLDPLRPIDLQTLQVRGVSDNLLLIGSPFAGKSAWLQQRVQQDNWHVIDFHQRSETHDPEEAALASHQVIALDHFEDQLGVPEQDHRKCLILEKLLSTHPHSVIILSTLDPVVLYGDDHTGREKTTAPAPADNHAQDAWARILSFFVKVYLNEEENAQDFAAALSVAHRHSGAPAGSAVAKRQRALLRLVEQECRPTAYLRQLGGRIVTASAFAEQTPGELRQLIWDQTCAYYQVVWSTCSPGEQFLLICLARDRFVNTRNPDIDRLLRKRLIVREPALRLMNASFERFVSMAAPPPQASTWAEEEKHSEWNTLKGPLAVVLTGAGVFLYVTQPGLFNATTAFASAVAAGGLPALLKLFSSFVQGDKTEP